MNFILMILLLQSLLLPPRTAIQNTSSGSSVPQKLKKDYDKLWTRFLAGKEDAKVSKDLDSLLKKQKGFTPAITISAYIDLYKGNDSGAVTKFRQILSINPNDSTALYYLGELAYADQDYAAANNYYSRLLAVDETRTDVEGKRQKALLLATDNLLRSAARAEQENRLADAEQLYLRALETAPREPTFNGRLAELLAKEKKWDEALARYRTQIEISGRNIEIEKNVAEALMNLGRTEEAREVLDRLRKQGTLDENLESKVNELEDLGRWGGEIGLYRNIKSADSITREQLAAIIVRYFPQVPEFPQNPQIVTDIQESWARPEIQVTVGTGLIDPFPNHTFQPSGQVTRGLLALSMSRLVRLVGLSPVDAPAIPTPDVTPGDALYRDVQVVLGSGLMGLEESGSFNVSRTVSGEEAVRAMERLLRLSHGNAG